MNAGAQANRDKAEKTALEIATLRSKGLGYKEIGIVLGLSTNACKQRVYRLRKGERHV